MKSRFILSFALLLLCSGIAVAKTPDWMTPSEETICDGETGAAFGLCNAYCEAMDCDSPNAQASATACSKVKGKFTNVTGRAFLPCEACPPPPPGTTCPCVAAFPEFDLVLSSPGTCANLGVFAIKEANGIAIAAACNSLGGPSGGFCATSLGNGLDITAEEGSACFYQILDSCTP
jgi:hypothetical protein